VPDLSGRWHLNVGKSSWGKRPTPVSVEVTITHREPVLKYSGTVTLDAQGTTRDFEFEGAIDGKEHPVVGGNVGEGKLTIRRLNQYTTASVAKSNDGQTEESATTTVSRDGRTMTRKLRLKRPDGVLTWTEVYERRL
jgi:hypothetical protein